MISEEQLKERQSGIGASEAAAVMGLDKWRTAAQVYAAKKGFLKPDEPGEAARFGNLLEEVVANEYAVRKGCKVRRNNKTLRHKEHDYMLCHLDRVVEGEKRIVECKTSSAFLNSDWGEEGTSEIPDPYLIQVHHQMAVTGYAVADVPVLIGGNKLKIYTVERDEDLINLVTDAVSDFWNNNILADNPPDFDYEHPSTSGFIKALYPDTDGNEVDITDLADWHNVMEDAKKRAKAYENVVESAKSHIMSALKNNTSGNIKGIGTYTRKSIKRKGFTVEPSEYMKLSFKKEDK